MTAQTITNAPRSTTCERRALDTIDSRAALTYAERRLAEGGLEYGIINGFTGQRAEIRDARRNYADFRALHGYAHSNAAMLTRPESQPKLGKGERYALGLMLTPARSLSLDILRVFDDNARPVNVCPKASAGCAAACLAYSGHGAFNATQRARQVRHAFLIQFPYSAGVLIGAELAAALHKHGADNVTFRFNVLSDYRIERVMPQALRLLIAEGVRVYDYTAYAPEDREPVAGYHLTYSAKESAHTPDTYLAGVLLRGHNVAMPFATRKGEPLPATYTLAGETFAVIDGDLTDDRTTDPITGTRAAMLEGANGVIVGLRAKGARGKADTSGFIRPIC